MIDTLGGSLEGTLIANVIGCFFLGAFMSSVTYLGMFTRVHRLFFVSGVIGSFTTFSTMMVQTFQSGPALGCLYLGGNLFFGIVGIYLGRFCIMYRRIS